MPIFWIGVGIVALIALMSKGGGAEASTRQLPAPLPPVPPPTPEATTAETTKAVETLLPVTPKPAEAVTPAPTAPMTPAQKEAVKAAVEQSPLTPIMQPAAQAVATTLAQTIQSLPFVEAFTPTTSRKITTEDIKVFQRELNKFSAAAKFPKLVVDGLLGRNTAGATVKTLDWIKVRDPSKADKIDAWKSSFVTSSGYNYNNLALALLAMTDFVRVYSASGVV